MPARVQDVVVVGRVAAGAQRPDVRRVARPQRQPVLQRQVDRQVEQVVALLVHVVVAVQVGGRDPLREHPLDLRPELALRLVQQQVADQLRDPVVGMEGAGLVHQRADLPRRQQRAPAVGAELAHQREVDAERDAGVLPQELRPVQPPRRRRHQRAGAHQPLADRPERAHVLGVAHAEVVGVDDQQARVRRVAQDAVGRRALAHRTPPSKAPAAAAGSARPVSIARRTARKACSLASSVSASSASPCAALTNQWW